MEVRETTRGYGETMTETTSAAKREGTAPTRMRKPRGEYAKSAATRTAILDAALEVFAESGYRAGSLREVAERVGMSEAGLLHHFRSKSALLMAVLDHRDELARALVDFDLPDGVEALRGSGHARRAQRLDPRGRRALLHAVRRGDLPGASRPTPTS